ncbi:MAG: glycosyltransferase family 4 protein [Ruminococcus sp.]|nr:glycosyltransferase family 4 protein [Ruminococcus sp.]
MKILFLDAYFYPENIAFSHLEWDVIEGLKKAGHEITVVCPTPSRGVSEDVYREYQNILDEEYRGVRIRRFKAPREGKNPIKRAFRYFYCNLKGLSTAKKLRDIDVIFSDSTPPTQGFFAGKLAKKLSVPLVYSLQDVFPDTLLSSGLMKKKSLLYRIGLKIEKKTYQRATKIIVISQTIHDLLVEKGVEEQKLITVSNWIDDDQVTKVERSDNTLIDEFGIDPDKFLVVYAGNFGGTQGTHVIAEAAKLLKDHPDIRFVVFGGGTDFGKCEEFVRENRLENIQLNPLQPLERISEVYSLGNVALVPSRKGYSKTGMASKTWSIMACETPIIASYDTDSEFADILTEYRAGVCVEPEDALALKEAIEEAYESYQAGAFPPSDARGREYVRTHASREICVKKYVDCFESVVG